MRNAHHRFLQNTRRDIQRLAQQRAPLWLGVIYQGGVLGLLLVVPIVGGAYLGRWLDELVAGYSVRWTVSLIVLGIALGLYNVVRFIRAQP